MSDAIQVALIALTGQIIIALASNSGIVAKLDKQSEVADARIHGEIDVVKNEVATLRQEVQKHNQLVERTFKLEQAVAVHDEKIKVANNRIADLENRAG